MSFYLPVLLFAIYVIGYFNAGNIKPWVSSIETGFGLLAFPLSFAILGDKLSQKNINIVLVTFACATILCCMIAHSIVLYQIVQNGDSISDSFKWNYSYAELTRPINIDPTYLSIYVIFSIFILLKKVQSEFKKFKAVILLAVVYLTLFLFLLSSRIGILSFLIILTFQVFIKLRKNRIMLTIAQFMLLATALFLYIYMIPLARERFLPILADFKSIFLAKPSSSIYDKRAIIYRCSFSVFFSDVSLIGIGVDNDRIKLNDCYRSNGYIELENFNSHNNFLTYAIRYGLFGLLFFVSLIVMLFYQSIKQKEILLNVLSILMFFTSLVESTFSRQKGIVFFTFFYCLLLLARKIDRKSKSARLSIIQL